MPPDLAAGLLSGEPLTLALRGIVQEAHRAVAGVDGAGAALHLDGVQVLLSASNPFADAVDTVQYGLGEGPCLHCFHHDVPIRLELDGSDPRWPGFVVASRPLGVGSVLSVPLRVEQRPVGSLNLYSRAGHVFGADALDQAELFARPSALRLSLAGVAAHAAEAAEVMGLELQDRATIDRALGVLMARHADGSPVRARSRLLHEATEAGVGLLSAAARVLAEHEGSPCP